MTRKPLKWWERRIRSRGIAPSEWLSVIALLLVLFWFGGDDALIIECTGSDPSEWSGRRAEALGRMLVAGLCSPLYALDGAAGWLRLAVLALVLLWCGGMIWLQRRRKAYWAPRDLRANQLAKERRVKKREVEEAEAGD